VLDFLNTVTYFRPFEKRKEARDGATAEPGEARILRICHFPFVIHQGSFEALETGWIQ
jgi:hypothetical protein